MTHEDDQRQMALWMGYDGPDAMNREHDGLHRGLCDWLGVESNAMRMAAGEELHRWEKHLAALEEEAVLHLQRFWQHARMEYEQTGDGRDSRRGAGYGDNPVAGEPG